MRGALPFKIKQEVMRKSRTIHRTQKGYLEMVIKQVLRCVKPFKFEYVRGLVLMSQESLAFTRAADILLPFLPHTHSVSNELYLLTAPSTMRSSGTHTTSSLSSISS